MNGKSTTSEIIQKVYEKNYHVDALAVNVINDTAAYETALGNYLNLAKKSKADEQLLLGVNTIGKRVEKNYKAFSSDSTELISEIKRYQLGHISVSEDMELDLYLKNIASRKDLVEKAYKRYTSSKQSLNGPEPGVE